MERRSVRILIILASLIMIFVFIGWIGFMLIGVPSAQALAATINILSSVGLGSPPVESTAGWVIIGILQIGSIGIVTVAVGALSQMIIAGAMKQYMGRYRMDERINKLHDHSIVAGFSLTGEALTKDLIAESRPFVVIERDPDIITRLEEQGLLYIEGDATDEKVLKQAGIERARAIFAVLSHDSDNLMVTLSARGLNEDIIIVSRATREDYIKRFLRAGADAAMSPQEWASRRMSAAVFRPHLLELLSSILDPTVSHAYLDEVELPKDCKVVGKTLADSGIRQAAGIVILGISRHNGELVSSPGPDALIEKGDVLIGFGQQKSFTSLKNFLKT